MTDPTFSDSKQRYSNLEIIYDAVGEWASKLTSAQCEETLNSSGCPFGIYKTIGEALTDPQYIARNGIIEVADAAGKFKVPNTPLHLTVAKASVGTRVPYLGEHNSDVLSDWLDFDQDTIQELQNDGALQSAP